MVMVAGVGRLPGLEEGEESTLPLDWNSGDSEHFVAPLNTVNDYTLQSRLNPGYNFSFHIDKDLRF